MSQEIAGQFLVDVSIALMEPDLARAIEQLKEVVSRETWISSLLLNGRGADGSQVEIRVGASQESREGAKPQGDEEPRRHDQNTIELTGIREGVPVWLKASISSQMSGQVLSELLRMFARRLKSHYTVTRVNEKELADAVGALSHDFRTPLACIKGYLSLLAEGKHPPGTPEWDEYFETVMEECERLEKLVSVVLESAAGQKVGVSRELVLLPPLIKRVLVEESAITRGHRFFVDVRPEAREVFADPTRLEQVLRNLLDNAIKYSPDDSLIVLRVRKTGEGTLFSVADQGGGIAPEHLNRLFERHYRVTDGNSANVEGTGLGLPIARQIVNAHGGDIWAESFIGKGSTFYFTIPEQSGLVPRKEDRK